MGINWKKGVMGYAFLGTLVPCILANNADQVNADLEAVAKAAVEMSGGEDEGPLPSR